MEQNFDKDKDVLTLCLVSPQKTIFQGRVRYVEIPGASGLFSVLPGHAPIITSLVDGVLQFKGGDTTYRYGVTTGFVEVNKDVVSICVEKVTEVSI